MATTSCPKCSSTRFELKEHPVANSKYRILFIQCSSCGAAVGTTEYQNTNSLIHNLAKKLGFSI
ncbi:hypothetical protein BWD41_16570 [Citrobacter braakii]|uniref:Uncharacterized protein n=1 Tax=Citrobacter braakii TaxID=57706 RepID=A0AA44LEE0_CITBR|nr:hypothetical protein [Citrobacter braakii]OLY68397.1 hypothetical protein BWD41_16570 [Citrobacter braakii]TCC61455.1 hypothetical protein EY918_03840 [Citrobacter braakii]WFZ46765.1 hypothetical protein NFK67_14215 [Citrobacter braakii]